MEKCQISINSGCHILGTTKRRKRNATSESFAIEATENQDQRKYRKNSEKSLSVTFRATSNGLPYM